jgi:protein-glutamine gamma-glutamyltransferase
MKRAGGYAAWANGRTLRVRTVVLGVTYLVCAIVLASVYAHINILLSLLFLALFGLAVYSEQKRRLFIPRWLLNGVSLAIVAFSIYRFDINSLIPQMMEALLMLIAIKLLEEKKVRDYMQIYAMALLLLSALGLVSLSISFLIYFTCLIVLLTVAVVILTFYSQDPEMESSRDTFGKIVSRSLLIPLIAIPLTLFMFIILPRSQYPLLNFLNRSDAAKTGFSDKVRLGGVSNIQEDSSIIFRVNMDKINDNDLYWRGIVFDYFDGATWTRSQKSETSMSRPVLLKGRSVNQTFYLEPYGNYFLFSLDKPVFLSIRGIRRNRDLTFASARFVERRIRYDAISILTDSAYDEGINRDLYLQTPDRVSSRIIKLVGDLTAQRTEEQRIDAIFSFLSRGAFKYSLQNLPLSAKPLETFLFETRYGNCEYFASALAVMLRIAGIPSRVVGGYKGGYYNEVGKYYLVPQKNAHVWVEAYTSANRWLRLDATPGSIDNYTSLMKGDMFLRMRVFLDTINYYWYAMVINYNFEKQLSILHTIRTGIRKPGMDLSLNGVAKKTYPALLLLACAAGVCLWWTMRRRKPVEKRLIALFLARMEKLGYRKGKSEGLEEFIASVDNAGIREPAERFVKEYEKLYFTDCPFSAYDVKKLKDLLKLI